MKGELKLDYGITPAGPSRRTGSTNMSKQSLVEERDTVVAKYPIFVIGVIIVICLSAIESSEAPLGQIEVFLETTITIGLLTTTIPSEVVMFIVKF